MLRWGDSLLQKTTEDAVTAEPEYFRRQAGFASTPSLTCRVP
jgi:hypothetical protein